MSLYVGTAVWLIVSLSFGNCSAGCGANAIIGVFGGFRINYFIWFS